MSTIALPDYLAPRSLLLLGAFLIVVVGVGAFIGINTAPGDWYAALNKPPFNPPNWLFGPVWFALYVMIAVAGWRIALLAPDGSAMKLWFAQMVLNWIWSPVWFSLHLLWPAFIVIAAMLLLILLFIWQAWRLDRTSAALFIPYAAWVAFAGTLNLSIAVLN
jgi:translocator protein